MATVAVWFRTTTTVAKDTHKLVLVRLQCAKALAVWSLALSCVVMPLFYKGANLYECGKPWMYLTAAYLADPSIEMAAAVLACLSFGIAAWCVRLLQDSVGNLYESKCDDEPPATTCRMIILWMLWSVITLFLSIPSALYIVSTSLPPGGIFGSVSLLFFQHAAAPALYSISAVFIPPLSRWAVERVTGLPRPSTAAYLMIFARHMVTLVVPFVMVLLLSQGCQARWLELWSPCQESSTFDISVTVSAAANRASGAGTTEIQVTKHSEVCDPASNPRYGHGRCPIAVVDALGTLLVEKLLFTALIGPVKLLLFNTKAAQQARQWVFKTTKTTDVDTEAAGIAMLLEMALVLGFVVPVMPLVLCVAFLLHARAFQICLEHQEVKLRYEAIPPVGYLWWSLLLGAGLVAWMFVECDWAGHEFVLAGLPISCLVGGSFSHVKDRLKRCVQEPINAPDLVVALLDPTSRMDSTMDSNDSVQCGLRDRSASVYFDAEEPSLADSAIENAMWDNSEEEFSGL